MEKALSLSPAALAGRRDLARWDRLWLGSSFCQALLPGAPHVEAALKAGAKQLTLAAPLLTGPALRAFLPELKAALRLAPDLEVSCCDLGLAAEIRRLFGRKVPLSLGRPASMDFIRMEKGELAGLMRELGFGWLESDEADLVRRLPAAFPFPVAFHYPLKYRAMSRLCPQTGRLNASCASPCAGRAFSVRPAGGGKALTVFENAYFTRCRPCAARRVQRLVKTEPEGLP